jgi:hypothetical protein
MIIVAQWGGSLAMIGRRLRWTAVILAVLGVMPVRAVDAHDWYSNLRQPITGLPCCGGYDCRPLLPQQIRYTKGGGMQFFLDDKWRDVDPAVVLEVPSPDSRVHACWNATDHQLLCVILPGAL